MAIIKARANYHNGNDYDTFHYETQAAQVLIMGEDGNKSSLQEMFIDGKQITGVALSDVKGTGSYIIVDCTDLPIELEEGKEAFMKVNTFGKLTRQSFIDAEAGDVYERSIYLDVVGDWSNGGATVNRRLSETETNIGDVEKLKTEAKTDLVEAVNEVHDKSVVNRKEIDEIKKGLLSVGEDTTTHNHDKTYMKLSGGEIIGDINLANEVSIKGKNNSGANLNIGKVDDFNRVVIGDLQANGMTLNARNLNVFDGVATRTLFHSGNMGSGSGLDADTLDGYQASDFIRSSGSNYFKGDQFIQDGKHIVLQAPTGSSQSGSIYFRDGSGANKGRINTNASSDLIFYAGSTSSHTMKGTGELLSTDHHIMDGSVREAAVKFRRNSADGGIGFHLSASMDRLQLYDWAKNVSLFTTERDTGMVSFTNHIAVQGRRVFFQSQQPTASRIGDMWFP